MKQKQRFGLHLMRARKSFEQVEAFRYGLEFMSIESVKEHTPYSMKTREERALAVSLLSEEICYVVRVEKNNKIKVEELKDIELSPEWKKIEENVLYIQLDKDNPRAFTYIVQALDGTLKTGEIKVKEIKNFRPQGPLTIEALQTVAQDILRITSVRGHTIAKKELLNESLQEYQNALAALKKTARDSWVLKDVREVYLGIAKCQAELGNSRAAALTRQELKKHLEAIYQELEKRLEATKLEMQPILEQSADILDKLKKIENNVKEMPAHTQKTEDTDKQAELNGYKVQFRKALAIKKPTLSQLAEINRLSLAIAKCQQSMKLREECLQTCRIGERRLEMTMGKAKKMQDELRKNEQPAPAAKPDLGGVREYSKDSAGNGSLRKHSFEVKAEKFANLDEKYKGLQGDRLKSEILADLKSQIDRIRKIYGKENSLEALKRDFVRLDEYKVLARGQDLFARLTGRASTLKTFNKLFEQRKEELLKGDSDEDSSREGEGTHLNL